MTIEDIMWKTTAAVWESDSLEQAARTLAEQGLAGAIACDSEGGMVGVVAVEDVLFGLVQGRKTVREVMRLPQPLPAHARLEEVEFGGSPLRAVVDESGRLVGLLTKEQYLAAYAKASRLRLKQLDAMFNAAHNGILSIDAKGRITSINPAAERMARTTKEEALGRFLTDVVVPSGLLEWCAPAKGVQKNTASASASILRTGRRLSTVGRSSAPSGCFKTFLRSNSSRASLRR